MDDKRFIIDYDTLDTILQNSRKICKDDVLCKKCEKEIIRFFAESCKILEYSILLNRQKKVNIIKTKYGGTYYFFDEEEILNEHLVISAWDFVNTALTNIFLNTEICNNAYFNVSPILVDGEKLDILEDGKRYIKFFIELQPEAVNLSRKNDKKRFIYK